MADFNEEQLEEIREAFEIFSSSPAEVAISSVGSLLRALNCNPSNDEIDNVLGRPSKEDMEKKTVKFEEFLPMYSQIMKTSVVGTYDDLIEGLRVFDKEGNNTVMGAEIRHVLRTLGEKLKPEEIGAVMDGKEDLNGTIELGEFCKYLLGEKSE